MGANDPTWSYGESKLYISSGATVANGDDQWSYGKDDLFHEYVVSAGVTIPIMSHHYTKNIGSGK